MYLKLIESNRDEVREEMASKFLVGYEMSFALTLSEIRSY
jgi:hypothetical protein